MDLPISDVPDSRNQRRRDASRLRRAAVASGLAALALLVIQALTSGLDIDAFTVTPHTVHGLLGLLTAPLLHAGWEHVLSNASAVLLLGTLAGSVYPRATLRALPLIWLGSGLGAWLLGSANEHHLGASGITHGLAFLVFVLGVLRRDRPAVAAGMIAFLLYGGMLVTVFPHEIGVSWQAHLGGALAGILAAVLLRRADPPAPRRRYSWELEDEASDVPAEVPHIPEQQMIHPH